MTLQEIIFLGVFFALVFVVPAIVVWASYSEHVEFNVSTLWIHNERVDKFAIIILGTWWIHSSSMILWTLLRSVTTADYATYMAWALPIIAKMFSPSNGKEPTK